MRAAQARRLKVGWIGVGCEVGETRNGCSENLQNVRKMAVGEFGEVVQTKQGQLLNDSLSCDGDLCASRRYIC